MYLVVMYVSLTRTHTTELWFYTGIYMSSIFGWVDLDFLAKYWF